VGDERYVKVRPNPEGLTHVEIFERLVGHDGTIITSGPDGPTQPFLIESHQLGLALDELATMIGQLSTAYQAESIKPAESAVEAMRGHMSTLAGHAARLADEFDSYVAVYHQVRNRMPEPVPGAAQLDAVEAHHPGLLAQLPFVAELEQANLLRTREARDLYHQLDQAAVAADEATPAFPSLAGATAHEVRPQFTATTAATAHGSSGQVVEARGTGAAPTPPAPGLPTTSAPVHPAGTEPVRTAGAGYPAARPAATVAREVPREPQARDAGRPWPALPPSRPGQGTADRGHAGRAGAKGNLAGRAGGPQHDVISSRKVTGQVPGGGRAGVGAAAPAEQSPAGRVAAARGASGGVGADPVGPMTPGTRERDRERKRPSYLEECDPEGVFGTDQRVAPPVLGVLPVDSD
jgi:hypothetical protein